MDRCVPNFINLKRNYLVSVIYSKAIKMEELIIKVIKDEKESLKAFSEVLAIALFK